jgi:hypothetical protein
MQSGPTQRSLVWSGLTLAGASHSLSRRRSWSLTLSHSSHRVSVLEDACYIQPQLTHSPRVSPQLISGVLPFVDAIVVVTTVPPPLPRGLPPRRGPLRRVRVLLARARGLRGALRGPQARLGLRPHQRLQAAQARRLTRDATPRRGLARSSTRRPRDASRQGCRSLNPNKGASTRRDSPATRRASHRGAGRVGCGEWSASTGHRGAPSRIRLSTSIHHG